MGSLLLASAVAIHLAGAPRWSLAAGYAATVFLIADFAAPLAVDRAVGPLRPGDTVLIHQVMGSLSIPHRGELVVFNSARGTRIPAPWPFRGDLLFPSRQIGQVIAVSDGKVRVMPGKLEISPTDIVGCVYWRCQPPWRWGMIP
jgi:hypothetical protein